MSGWIARCEARLSGPRSPVALGVCLSLVFAVSLAFRIASLEAVEIGGDALRVWEFSRRIAIGASLPAELNHHQARFGLVVPTVIAQWLFGTSATTYYVGPLFFSALLHTSTFFVAYRLSGMLAGFAAVGGLFWFEEMTRASSQILPELFGPTYVMLAVSLGLCWIDAKSRTAERLSIAMASLTLFLAYGAKLSYLYFAPGVGLLFWLGRAPKHAEPSPSVEAPTPRGLSRSIQRYSAFLTEKRLVAPVLLTLGVVGLIAIETLVYRAFTEQTSQLAVVERTHGVSREATVKKAADLFAIYRTAGRTWHQLLIAGGLGLVVAVAAGRNRAVRIYALLVVIYLALFTFVLRSWSPPIPWARPHPRYLLAVAPSLAVLIGVGIEELLRLSTRFSKSRGARVVEALVLPTLGFGLLASIANKPVRGVLDGLPKRHALHATAKLEETLTTAFGKGLPLVTRTSPPKPLRAAISLYVAPKLLEKNGELRDVDSYIDNASPRGRRPLHYSTRLLLDGRGRELDRAVRERDKDGECLVTLAQSGRFLRVLKNKNRHCEPLEPGAASEEP